MKAKFELFHFALYAKNWYKRFNPQGKRKTLWDDLRCTFTGDGYYGEAMSVQDMVGLIIEHCSRIDNRMFSTASVLSGVDPRNTWQFGYYTKQTAEVGFRRRNNDLPDYDYETAIVYYYMSCLRNLDKNELPIPIRPSSLVLPIANGVTLKSMIEIFRELT